MILSTLEAGKEDGADAAFALLSASAYIWPEGHLYCCASAIANGVCIALGFCVYLVWRPFILLRLGNANEFALLSASAYICKI